MTYIDILCDLLECGYADAEMLTKIKYDFSEIKNEINGFEDTPLTLKNILFGAIWIYQSNIQTIIDEKIDNQVDGYEELKKLNPFYDIEYFINYLDTHIYIVNDELRAIYRKYLSDEIERENDNIGFTWLDLESE